MLSNFEVYMMDKCKNERKLQDSFYLRQNELTQKSITLQVINDHVKVNKQLCEERKLLLRKEIKALDEIHSTVWQLQNRACNRFWDFSIKHDLSEVVPNYPHFSSEFNLLCECERKSDDTDEENGEIEKLILEIQKLELNLKIVNCDSLRAGLVLAEKELQMLEKDSPENESLKKEIKACEERISSLRSRIGAEHTRIENSKNILSETLKDSNISSKTNLDNLKKVNKFSNTTSVTSTNFATSKENCSLNENSVSDRGGFVTASAYLSTIDNPMPLQNTKSYQKAVINAFSAEKVSALTNLPKKKFVAKTKSGITQRR